LRNRGRPFDPRSFNPAAQAAAQTETVFTGDFAVRNEKQQQKEEEEEEGERGCHAEYLMDRIFSLRFDELVD